MLNNIDSNLPYTGPELKRCQYCGHIIEKDYIYCVDCGNKIYGTKRNIIYETKKFFFLPSKKQKSFKTSIKRIVVIFLIVFILLKIINNKIYIKYNPGFSLYLYNGEYDKTNFNDAYSLIEDSIFSQNDIIRKYNSKIRVKISGDYNKKDVKALEEFVQYLYKNADIDIEVVDNNSNVNIIFDDKIKIKEDYGNISYTYSNNNISSSKIVMKHINTEGYTNIMMIHNILHALGLKNDTTFKNSILNKKLSINLTSTDALTIKMLYDNNIKSGMSSSDFSEYFKLIDYAEYVKSGDES